MRKFLFIPFLFSISVLAAQNYKPEYYQNQYEPQAQKKIEVNCYVRKVDAATAAFRRGDFRAAQRLFEEAKTCPETKSSSRRSRDLDAKINNCKAQLERGISRDVNTRNAGIEITGRRFIRSKVFTRNVDPNCFQITVKEAERAFRDSCWDDAAKLYRAAKTCQDASQTDRERMNAKIEACREAAEDELLQKEQQAIRSARHALAAGLSDDVLDLLRQGNRSLAWRLGDFANFYIAPDDNPDCLDAMYTTYYYEQPANENEIINPPFGYHLYDELSLDAQLKFLNIDEMQLVVYNPSDKKVMIWQFPDFQSQDLSWGKLKDPIGFDAAPDGSAMLYGRNYFYLEGPEATIPVQRVKNYCFGDSDESLLFFYEEEGVGIKIFSEESMSRIQKSQNPKYDKMNRVQSASDAIPIGNSLLAMQYYKGELWLGYPDRVEILDVNADNLAVNSRKVYQLQDSTLWNSGVISMRLFPEAKKVIIGNESESQSFVINSARVPDGSIRPEENIQGDVRDCHYINGHLLAVTTELTEGTWDEIMTVRELAEEPVILNRFYTNSGSTTRSATLSLDGRWLVAQDMNGKVIVWALKDSTVSPPVPFKSILGDQFSADGNHLFSKQNNEFKVYDLDDIDSGAEKTYETILDPIVPEGRSNEWAVYFSSFSRLSVQNFHSGQQHFFDVEGLLSSVPYTLDKEEASFFAYSPTSGVVRICSLTDGAIVSSRDFGGQITQLKFIPGTEQILVVSRSSGGRYTVKVWNYVKSDEPLKVLRLQDYTVRYVRVCDQGDKIALCNTEDIRIFLLDNLNDENVVIKPSKSNFIIDIEFRPDGLALVSSDDEGDISIWDVSDGKSLLNVSNTWEGKKYSVSRLAFAYGGSRLRVLSSVNDLVMTVDLDPISLRDVVQSGSRWLTSFSSKQIRDYNLEIAFKYPGNFDRLASSGDLPLIRSFFQYFREQSISSNNIDQVRSYCDRAYFLFEKLDSTNRGNHEAIMLEMYEDFVLKLLLRNNEQEAAGVVEYLKRRFPDSEKTLLSGAHTALIQRNFLLAQKLYANYLKMVSTAAELFDRKLEEIYSELSQFQEYGLLDSLQVNCLCGLFQKFPNFEKLCPSDQSYDQVPAISEVFIFRDIYNTIDSAAFLINNSARTRLLERTLDLAKSLQYENANLAEKLVDTVSLALADAYLIQANAEQNSYKVPGFYKKSLLLLESMGTFNGDLSDSTRIAFIAKTQTAWGAYLLKINQPYEALQHLKAGFYVLEKLPDTQDEANGFQREYSWKHLYNPLLLNLCRANLLLGEPLDATHAIEDVARFEFNNYKSIYTGHINLLVGDEAAALESFVALPSPDEFAEAIFLVYQMAELLPVQAERLKAFVPNATNRFILLHPDYSSDEINNYLSFFQYTHYDAMGMWDSAIVWSERGLASLERLMKKPDHVFTWRESWYSTQIYHVYYLLAGRFKDTSVLTQVIRLSEEVEKSIERDDPYSGYKDFVFTNLAHAYYLRNRPGDREKALDTYRMHLNTNSYYYDPWETLQQDFRNLHHAGVQWPDLVDLVHKIKPANVMLTQEDWREMGVE
ncbi:MAG: WD40 repeat domain-containing protein [Saprospiraceae bacterium]